MLLGQEGRPIALPAGSVSSQAPEGTAHLSSAQIPGFTLELSDAPSTVLMKANILPPENTFLGY